MKIIYKINDIKKTCIKENLEAVSKKEHDGKTIIISTLEYFKKKESSPNTWWILYLSNNNERKEAYYYKNVTALILPINYEELNQTLQQLSITSYLDLWDINSSLSSHVSMYVTQNMDRSITVESIASFLSVSVTHIDKYFKFEHQCSASDYIRKLKINHSIWLLSNTDIPISEVALRIGYNDQSAFNHSFKKQMGTTPLKYRKSQKTPTYKQLFN
ncbi:helix-turn-helix domain-containing protein [Marinomonas profundimaris]|uniref:HTH araC/xylS-type domain-containing protein n=1 Tax=Marinomonas profundimaris TaxID=1208321 RepID=W1RZA3_9GAMM|nr:AraC family transcriptional regulator [Marinomonas profundimaris]ETI62140.1 hypothetical protein D104_02225 [Marinomonas profundimaris]